MEWEEGVGVMVAWVGGWELASLMGESLLDFPLHFLPYQTTLTVPTTHTDGATSDGAWYQKNLSRYNLTLFMHEAPPFPGCIPPAPTAALSPAPLLLRLLLPHTCSCSCSCFYFSCSCSPCLFASRCS